jgi:hypothetical protein
MNQVGETIETLVLRLRDNVRVEMVHSHARCSRKTAGVKNLRPLSLVFPRVFATPVGRWGTTQRSACHAPRAGARPCRKGRLA